MMVNHETHIIDITQIIGFLKMGIPPGILLIFNKETIIKGEEDIIMIIKEK